MKKHLLTLCLAALSVMTASAEQHLFPWEQVDIPEDIRRTALEENSVLTEETCDWRQPVADIFRPSVQDCKSAREAVLKIAANMTELTGVYYSTERRKPDMNALEALAEKKVSCSGQTALMVSAFRSVGIPARAVCILCWNHVRGNHSWCEVWIDGGWHMIEFNEKDFNTPWVMEAIGMIDPSQPYQRIYALNGNEPAEPSAKENEEKNWSPLKGKILEDVTARYQALAKEWYAKNGLPADQQKLMVDVKPRLEKPRQLCLADQKGKVLAKADSPVKTDDVRKFATLALPRGVPCYLLVIENEKTITGIIPIQATAEPVQIVRLGKDEEEEQK